MKKLRYGLIALLLLCSVSAAEAQISIGIGLPNVSIGINLPLFPELVPVPGYPVYYAPRVDANYFFYDGMYWVYQDDNWYASSWYNGPWSLVYPEVVPLFILRIPVYYYRQPPVYFRGWQSNAPPRWGEHWGHGWEQRRSGWDRWDRRSAPAPAPLPVYQRQYSGDRYPRQVEQQQTLRSQHYRYQPREKIVRQHFKQQAGQKTPAPAQPGRQEATPLRKQELQRSKPLQQNAPAGTRAQPQQRGGEKVERLAPVQPSPQRRGPVIKEQRQQPGPAPRVQQAPKPQGQVQRPQPQQRGGEKVQRPAPVKAPPQQRGPAIQGQRQQPGAAPRVQQAPKPQGQVQRPQPQQRGPAVKQPGAAPRVQQAPKPQGQGQGQQKDEERGRGHNN
jgi:hypothetical protein